MSIEILIAFAILVVALTGLLRAFSGSLHATAKAEHYAAAVLSARSILERVGSDIPMQDGMQSGRAEDGTETGGELRSMTGVIRGNVSAQLKESLNPLRVGPQLPLNPGRA